MSNVEYNPNSHPYYDLTDDPVCDLISYVKLQLSVYKSTFIRLYYSLFTNFTPIKPIFTPSKKQIQY